MRGTFDASPMTTRTARSASACSGASRPHRAQPGGCRDRRRLAVPTRARRLLPVQDRRVPRTRRNSRPCRRRHVSVSSGVVELLTSERPQRLEQPVTGGAVLGVLGVDHRLLDEAGQAIDHVPALRVSVGHDCFGGGGVEAPDEHPEPVEHQPFGRFEQRVRPLDRRAQGLVALDPAVSSAGEEAEALVEPCRDLGRAHRGRRVPRQARWRAAYRRGDDRSPIPPRRSTMRARNPVEPRRRGPQRGAPPQMQLRCPCRPPRAAPTMTAMPPAARRLLPSLHGSLPESALSGRVARSPMSATRRRPTDARSCRE